MGRGSSQALLSPRAGPGKEKPARALVFLPAEGGEPLLCIGHVGKEEALEKGTTPAGGCCDPLGLGTACLRLQLSRCVYSLYLNHPAAVFLLIAKFTE